MNRKILYFLGIDMAVILTLCVAVFIGMYYSMNVQNRDTMNEVGQLYMSEVSNQIGSHFGSVMDLRLSMTAAIVERTPPEFYGEYGLKLEEELVLGGQVRNFSYLALCSSDGELDAVYGEPVEIINEEYFMESLSRDNRELVVGRTESGKIMLLFGVRANYPMKDGEKSVALVAGLPIEYVNHVMNYDMEDSLVYFDIIRKDGDYITHNADPLAINCFERLSDGDYDGRSADEVLSELKQAIAMGEDYSVIVTIGEQRRNIYCKPLRDSEWYLVSVMFHRNFDTAVERLGHRHLIDAIVTCCIILLAMLGTFIVYFRMSGKQMAELEAARQEADRASRAKSEFLSNMSHDIRTPMNGIVGMTAIATANVDKPDVIRDCLSKITASSTHLLGLINDVLDMSKIESGKLALNMEQISLRDAMESLVSIVSPQIKSKKQTFDIFINDIEAEEVRCDGVRLNQILINLLSNAIKFTPEGGSVYVTLSQEASPRGEDYVRTHIRVKDNGIGMSEEFQAKIYDSFARADDKRVERVEGTGLGMAITKYIIDEMKGTIELYSELGKGSEFHITLDLERATVHDADMKLPDWDILVVDDDEQMCRAAVSSLEAIGAHAEYAIDGADALELVQKRHEENRDYNIVLLDWRMPDMDGIETARRIRSTVGEAIPILSISAYDWSDIEEEAKKAGINGFIAKPLFKSTLFYGLIGYADNPPEKMKTQDDAQAMIFAGKRLLIAEDYDMNWEIIEALLAVHGFVLERAENGQVCVDKFKASEKGFYDAILMDVRMPVMNGYEAAQAIRNLEREDSNVPIIAMTADAFSEDIQRCLECGMNSHVAKPINLNELLNNLKKFLQV